MNGKMCVYACDHECNDECNDKCGAMINVIMNGKMSCNDECNGNTFTKKLYENTRYHTLRDIVTSYEII